MGTRVLYVPKAIFSSPCGVDAAAFRWTKNSDDHEGGDWLTDRPTDRLTASISFHSQDYQFLCRGTRDAETLNSTEAARKEKLGVSIGHGEFHVGRWDSKNERSSLILIVKLMLISPDSFQRTTKPRKTTAEGPAYGRVGEGPFPFRGSWTLRPCESPNLARRVVPTTAVTQHNLLADHLLRHGLSGRSRLCTSWVDFHPENCTTPTLQPVRAESTRYMVDPVPTPYEVGITVFRAPASHPPRRCLGALVPEPQSEVISKA
ncbi:hypothetical protein QBC35DRAFT_84704 [Podospora australis]|uniref:Uncharacterized protein n=1 Tax=Podospora australis TaxID=1536484 RepID=A0AAN6WLX5_9PEZI|nr:hypothetical protein QBC35DRAFT_84704 [Podospora australis]